MNKILITLLILLLSGGMGLQTAAAEINVNNIKVTASNDGGALTWNNDPAAPIVTMQGGTVKFEQGDPLETMAGITYHLDASQLALNDGDPVATWTDLSANGNDFTQPTPGLQPSYASSVANLNGMPAVYFDMGASNKLTLDTGGVEGNGVVIIVGIMRGSENTWGGGIWGGYNATAPNEKDFGVRIRSGGQWNISQGGNNEYMGDDDEGYYYANGAIEADGRLWSNGGQATGAPPEYYMGDGTAEPTSFLMMASRGGTMPVGYETTSLGEYFPSRAWDGYMAEVICFDDILDISTATLDASIQQIGYNLTQKYGLPADPRYADIPIDTSTLNLVIEPGTGPGITPETTIDVSEIPEFVASNPILFKSLTVNTGGTLRFANATPNTAEDVGTVVADFLAGTGGTVTLAGTDLTLGGSLAAVDSHAYEGVITGAGSTITKVGDGTQILAGNNTYTGTTTINAGTLQLGNGGTTGAVAGDVVLAAGTTLAVSRSNEHTLADVIGGTLSGAGTVGINNAATGVTIFNADLAFATEVNSGALQLGDGTFTGTLTDAQSKISFANNTVALALNLPGTTAAPGTQFNLNTGTLRLRGANTYSDTFLGNTATNYNNLVVDAGTKLEVRVAVGGAGLVVANDITIAPEDVAVDFSAIPNPQENDQFAVLDAGSGSIYKTFGGAAWSPADAPANDVNSFVDYSVRYTYQSGLLSGLLILKEAPTPQELQGITNPDAVATLLDWNNLAPAGTPIGDFQRELQDLWLNGTPIAEIDRLVQQFTPSMAAASYAESVTANAQIMQLVGSQLTIPWERTGRGRNELVRAQNTHARNIYHVPEPILGKRMADNLWFQSFGYSSQQAIKDGFAPYNGNGWGFATGAERRAGDVLLGFAYGYTSNNLTTKPWNVGEPTPNAMDIQTHTLLGYALAQLGENGFIAGKAGATWSIGDGESYLPLVNMNATYKMHTSTLFGQLTLGYHWIENGNFRLTPKVRVGYFDYGQDPYDVITSDGITAMHSVRYSSQFGECDWLLDWAYQVGNSVTLSGSLGFRNMFGADGATWSVGGNDIQFNINGIQPAVNYLVLDAGVDCLVTENMSLVLEYNLRAGDGGYSLHGGTGTFVWRL